MSNNVKIIDKRHGISAFFKPFQHPGVLTALVTAVFGSLAVAIATGYVTKELGEREMQVAIIEALLEYTQKPEFIGVAALSKLEAMTNLIDDNKDLFDIDVKGFLKLIESLRFDDLSSAREKVQALENQQAELQIELQKGSENELGLQQRIDKNKKDLSDAKRDLLKAETNLDGAEKLIKNLQLEIEKKQEIINRLQPTESDKLLKEGQNTSFQGINVSLINIGDVKNNADFSYGFRGDTMFKITNVLEGNSFANFFPKPFNGELVVRVLSVDRQEKAAEIKLIKYPRESVSP